MSKRWNFFATRSDLLPGLETLDATSRLWYVLAGMFESPEVKVMSSLLQIESLGICQTGRWIDEDYLVLTTHRVRVRRVRQRRGGVRFAVDQLFNPVSTVICPGGLYDSACLVAGNVATASDLAVAERLNVEVGRTLVNGFQRIGAYYVGAEALALFRKGLRLVTMSVNEPPEFDLGGKEGIAAFEEQL